MKILHVTPFFYGAWAYGGIPRLSYHLASAQAAMGHTVEAVTTDVHDKSSRRPVGNYEVSGVKVRVYPNLSNLAAYHYQFFCPKGIGAEAQRIGDYDVIHIHGHRNLLNTYMARIAYQARVPTVLMPNGTLVNIERRQVLKTIYDLLLGRSQVKSTSAFVAVSKAEEGQFVRMGIPRSIIRVIPNGVAMDTDTNDKSFSQKFGIKDRYLLYLGKITPRKGIEFIISALLFIKDPSIMLVIAGNDMGYERELRSQAQKMGVSGRVVFTGLVTGPLKAAAYKEALYTIYPGRDEIFGLVPWESVLCGTPVIVADDSGCGEWIGEGKAGHVVQYADARVIGNAINDRDEKQDKEMVMQGARFCKERLDWGVIASDMVDYYKEIVA